MKKLIQFFAAVLIIATCFNAQAGTNKHLKLLAPAQQDSSSVRSNFIGLHPLGGEVILVVTVLDINDHPIQGANVSAPCTGLANQLTNSAGQATFNMGNTCTCNQNTCTVTTSKGCLNQFKVSCGTYQTTCNQ